MTDHTPDYDSILAAIEQGETEQAKCQLKQIVAASPDETRAHFELGNLLAAERNWSEAIEAFQCVLRQHPQLAAAHFNLGNAYLNLAQFDKASEAYQEVIAVSPSPQAYCNLAVTRARQEMYGEAISTFRQALELDPRSVDAHLGLARLYQLLGKPSLAINECHATLELNSNVVEAYAILGRCLREIDQLEAAISCLEHAIEKAPEDGVLWWELGVTQMALAKLDEAIQSYEHAARILPHEPELLSNLGELHKSVGNIEASVDAHSRANQLEPGHAGIHSNLMLAMLYSPQYTNEDLHQAAIRFGQLPQPRPSRPRATLRPDLSSRKIRIGFLSPDLRQHPVGRLIQPVFRCLNRERFEIYAYHNYPVADSLSEWLAMESDAWLNVAGMTDAEVIERIVNDQLDLLVDLAGHTANHRLAVMAARPAPLQASWLGYSGTIGLTEIDYLLADAQVIPSEQEPYYVERIARLPESYICLDPPESAPPVGPLPMIERGSVTFGSLNNPAKITADVAAVWSQILLAVPDSRLFLKGRTLGNPYGRAQVLRKFQVHGISSDRIVIAGQGSRQDVFETYQEIDLGLDPFPFAGGLTTLESFFMGVPVISLAGSRFVSRVANLFHSHVGTTDLIAKDSQEYVAKAVQLAADRERLAELRRTLRPRLGQSPLGDPVRFTRGFETTVEKMLAQHISTT